MTESELGARLSPSRSPPRSTPATHRGDVRSNTARRSYVARSAWRATACDVRGGGIVARPVACCAHPARSALTSTTGEADAELNHVRCAPRCPAARARTGRGADVDEAVDDEETTELNEDEEEEDDEDDDEEEDGDEDVDDELRRGNAGRLGSIARHDVDSRCFADASHDGALRAVCVRTAAQWMGGYTQSRSSTAVPALRCCCS